MSTADPRAEYRRRLKHRQTTVIGGMITFLALLVIICLLVWLNILPVPYDNEEIGRASCRERV